MDITAVYTLSPPVGSPVVLNDGEIGDGTDVFFITDIKGLDVAAIRSPQFKNPLEHGGYKPVPWLEEPLHPAFEGAFLPQTEQFGSSACNTRRIEMYHELKAALRNCYDGPATLAWIEPGVGALELEVSYEVPFAHAWDPYPMIMTFTFGLFSEASQPVAA